MAEAHYNQPWVRLMKTKRMAFPKGFGDHYGSQDVPIRAFARDNRSGFDDAEIGLVHPRTPNRHHFDNKQHIPDAVKLLGPANEHKRKKPEAPPLELGLRRLGKSKEVGDTPNGSNESWHTGAGPSVSAFQREIIEQEIKTAQLTEPHSRTPEQRQLLAERARQNLTPPSPLPLIDRLRLRAPSLFSPQTSPSPLPLIDRLRLRANALFSP